MNTVGCDKQIGFVLLQKQPSETDRSLRYLSRFITEAEREYDTTRRKCLAEVWVGLLIRLYLEGFLSNIFICQDAMKSIKSLTELTWLPVRWRLKLSKFE